MSVFLPFNPLFLVKKSYQIYQNRKGELLSSDFIIEQKAYDSYTFAYYYQYNS